MSVLKKKSNVFLFLKRLKSTSTEKRFFMTSFVLISLFYSYFIFTEGLKLRFLYEFIAWQLFLVIVFLIERGVKNIYQKIGAKKINTVLLMLFLIGVVNSYIDKGYFYSVSNHFREGFYFEKFETADAAFEEIRVEKVTKTREKYPSSGNSEHMMSDNDYKRIDIRRENNNYKSDVTTELLKLHPIGSDVYDIFKTLKKAGARCEIYITKTIDDKQFYNGKWHNTKKRINIIKNSVTSEDDDISCYYKEAGIIFPTDWRIFVEINSKIKINRITGVVYATPL